MSTHSTVKSAALNDVTSIIAGIQEYLPQLLELQENQKIGVTYDPNAKTVRMHGSERTNVNKGVVRFSDMPYDVGINQEKDGTVTLHYDSWVSGGKLRKRINGKSTANEPANIKTCQNYWRANLQARRVGKKMRTAAVDGKLLAFVPA
jgi:hypothetical protein